MRGIQIDTSDFLAFLAEPSLAQTFSPLNPLQGLLHATPGGKTSSKSYEMMMSDSKESSRSLLICAFFKM
jgi:hypothetical protein